MERINVFLFTHITNMDIGAPPLKQSWIYNNPWLLGDKYLMLQADIYQFPPDVRKAGSILWRWVEFRPSTHQLPYLQCLFLLAASAPPMGKHYVRAGSREEGKTAWEMRRGEPLMRHSVSHKDINSIKFHFCSLKYFCFSKYLKATP